MLEQCELLQCRHLTSAVSSAVHVIPVSLPPGVLATGVALALGVQGLSGTGPRPHGIPPVGTAPIHGITESSQTDNCSNSRQAAVVKQCTS